MGDLSQNRARPTGPRVVRVRNGGFQAVGLPEVSPMFASRAAAESWLQPRLDCVPASMRQQLRRCLHCGLEFQSEGFHNRMCTPCRHLPESVDVPYRIIRGGRRG